MNASQVAALRGQLKQLQAQHDKGALSNKDYERERARIERALLDQVLVEPADAATAEQAPRAPRSVVALMSVGVVVIAMAGYSWTGSPSLATGPVPVAQAERSPHDGGAGEQEFAAAVDALAEKLKQQPDNAQGWVMLARSAMQIGRAEQAVTAFQKALALVGEDAQLLADYADALAVKNNRSLEGEPNKLIERALKADPNNLKALALAGTVSFNRQDFAGAVRHWEKLASVAPPDTPWREQMQSSLAEARSRAGMAAAPMPAAAPSVTAAAAPMPPPAAQPPAATGGKLSGTVNLSPALRAQASPTDTVFVFARPAEGSRMPLALMRVQVKDLPVKFAFDDAMAMSPAAKLSQHTRVVVDARISKSGQAQAAAGDLTGRSAPVANDAGNVVIEINEVVKP
jgi:cytochrome c-type biogenesis protein CcmH